MTEEIQNNKELRSGSGFWVLVWDRLLDTFDKLTAQITGQVTSGRWILTVAAAVIMVKTCWSHPDKVVEFKEIIAVIIYAYFNKPPEKDGQEIKTTETKITSEVKSP